ncbi:MAG: beta-ketoacyl-ACP synthase III [Deinococcales bacterium]
MNVGISAIGTYLPEKILTNKDLELTLETTDEWIRSRTGIGARHIAAENQFTSHLAIAAVENLQRKHGSPALEGVDLVIVATATPDAFFPSTAALVQAHFGLRAAAFDILVACAGWVYALNVARGQILAGASRKALVIGAETFSKIVNWYDRNTAVLFGDGAGAAILEASETGFGFAGFCWGADGTGAKFLHSGALGKRLPSGEPLEPFVVQNGREVFKFAARIMPEAISQVIANAGWRLEHIDRIVPHQANARIIEAASERLGLAAEKFVVSIERHANNSAATIPLALEFALEQEKIKKGDKIVLVGFGGGLAWSAAALTWGY